MKKYDEVTVNYKAYEICFYYENEFGLYTMSDLFNWESKDRANRLLREVDDKNEATKITNSKKLLKEYI